MPDESKATYRPGRPLTVGALKAALKDLPDDLPVCLGTLVHPNEYAGQGARYEALDARYVRREREDGEQWVAISDRSRRHR